MLNINSLFVMIALLATSAVIAGENFCSKCHQGMQEGINAVHKSISISCVSCHRGQQTESDKETAHAGLIISPGELSNAAFTCGNCHQGHVEGVLQSRMHTGSGIVEKTRNKLEPEKLHAGEPDFQNLQNGIADSLLRKLCVSCHLGQTRNKNSNDPVKARGGGCLACHLNQTTRTGHPRITMKVDDSHCFGCHSRSGRISLNYAGLAEAELSNQQDSNKELAQLSDGRVVHKETADVHHKAGMACIDCHTGTGLMNLKAADKKSSVDISCNDCHANNHARITVDTWPAEFQSMREKIPFGLSSSQPFLQTSSGTPLWHIEVKEEKFRLYPKLGGKPLMVPQIDVGHRPLSVKHRKLTCDACHASWIPQCLGCHIEYDANQKQWDHFSGSVTEGRWIEKRWDVGTAAPTMGWIDRDTISIFMPGMVMMVDHPEYSAPRLMRHFAAAAPHTTGKVRGCKECHESALMLGLGEGDLKKVQDKMRFSPKRKYLADGLTADAWTSLKSPAVNKPGQYPRPLSNDEIHKIYSATENFKQE